MSYIFNVNLSNPKKLTTRRPGTRFWPGSLMWKCTGKHNCGFVLLTGMYVEADMHMQLTFHMYYKSFYETQLQKLICLFFWAFLSVNSGPPVRMRDLEWIVHLLEWCLVFSQGFTHRIFCFIFMYLISYNVNWFFFLLIGFEILNKDAFLRTLKSVCLFVEVKMMCLWCLPHRVAPNTASNTSAWSYSLVLFSTLRFIISFF